ncbi:hypothetical protein PIB30_059612, partial [Stylosanthes scabra]|nr:hypothetical protein [Stylosanthes scabra]
TCKSWALVYLTEPCLNQVVTWVWRGVGLGSTLHSRFSMRMARSGVLVTLSPRLYLVVARSGVLFVALDPCPYLVKARSWCGSNGVSIGDVSFPPQTISVSSTSFSHSVAHSSS